MKATLLWLLLVLPLPALASQPMTTPPKTNPHTHFTLLPGHNQLLLNVTHWTSFKLTSDYPVAIYEDGCKGNVTGVTSTMFICTNDDDLTITDDRSYIPLIGHPNVVRIQWISIGDAPIPVFPAPTN